MNTAFQSIIDPVITTNLSHLPKAKQDQLQLAVDIILEKTQPSLLILFGSYARGNWLESLADDGVHYRYQSGFDLLAIVKNEALAIKIERKNSLHKRLGREVETPINLIAEDIQFVNRRLRSGQYFYSDMLQKKCDRQKGDKQEGIVLHDSGEFELATPNTANSQIRQAVARDDFDYWFTKATKYREYSDIAMSKGDFGEAAFFLHQSAERFYGTILLVFTRYRPSSHDLRKLSQRVTSIEPQFLTVFPQGSAEEQANFELLRKAYINARYKPSFAITQPILAWLSARVLYLQTLTEQLCQAKIARF